MSEELNINSKIGEEVHWKTISGEIYEGVLMEWDSNVAIIKTKDGYKAVEG
jgi:hypothetical protein